MYFYNNVSNIIWEHVYKFETNLMNTNDPKSLLKECVTDVTDVTDVTIAGCDGRDRCDSSNSFLALEFPIIS
jgi:hypothetical protein